MAIRDYRIWHSLMTGQSSVKMYAYYDILLRQILYLYYMGRHQLLLSISGPLDMPYSVEPWCISAFGGHIELSTHLDNGSDNRMLNQMKTQDICCECTLRGMLAKLLSGRESQSSRLVLTRSMSAWRLLATHKTGVFIAKKWQEIMHGGVWCNLCCPLVTIWAFWWETHLDPQSNCVSPVPKGIQLQPTVCHWTGVEWPLHPMWHHPLDKIALAET